MASTLIRDCPVLFNDDVLGVPKGKKSAASPRKRKSAMKDFQTQEEYKRFAKSRNAATKRCRQKKEEELKILREENPALREENARLRLVVDTLKLNGSDSATTKIVMAENAALKGRVADLERELEEALCKLKLGSTSPGPAKVVTLALRSKKQKEPDLVQQALDTSLGDIFDNHFDELVLGKEDAEDKTVDELDISIIPSVPYVPELDPFQPDQVEELFRIPEPDANVLWS